MLGGRQRKSKETAAAAAVAEAAATGGVVTTPLLSTRLSGKRSKMYKKNFVLRVGLMRRGGLCSIFGRPLVDLLLD